MRDVVIGEFSRPMARLHQLTNRKAMLVANEWPERSTPCFSVKNEGDSAKVYVYDVIGGWDLDAAEFVKNVHQLDVPTIDVHINSPGGFVYDGVAMFEALKSHPATVNMHVDGLAASAASFLAMAGDTVDIAKAGRMMIHDAQGIAIGSPADFREYADLLDAVSNDISGYYADRAGGSAEEWRGRMTATTWYSSAQAVESGLADQIAGSDNTDAAANHLQNRSRLIKARMRATLGGVK